MARHAEHAARGSKEKDHTLGLRTTMGLPVPMEPLASSTLQVLAKASTKTAGSRAMTGEMVLKNDLTAIADEGPPATFSQCTMQERILFLCLRHDVF